MRSRAALRRPLVLVSSLAIGFVTACSSTDAPVDPRPTPLPVADAYESKDGVLHLRIRVRPATDTIDGKPYNGLYVYDTSVVDGLGVFTKGTASSYVGPEWRIQPGDRLILDYVNELPNYDFTGVDGVKESLPQPVNLHTHGLIVSPTGNADNVLLSIPPQRSNRYTIDVPKTQHEGLYWYHPHIHGLTDDQVYGGLAGQIVVGRADGNYLEFDGLEVHRMMLRYNVQRTGADGQLIDASPWDAHGTALVSDGGDMVYTTNGVVAPAVRIHGAEPDRGVAAESQVWALTNATGSASYVVALEEVDADKAKDPSAPGTPVDMVIVSVDGSPLPKPWVLSGERAKSGYHLVQGGRVALLVQGASSPSKAVRLVQVQNRSGSGERSAYDWNKQQYIGGWRDYTRDVLAIGVTDASVRGKHVDVPASLTPHAPVHVQSLGDEPVEHRRTFVFNDVAPPSADSPNEFPVNFGVFPENRLDQPRAGTVEEWTILNYSSLTHPFHFHTQYGEVMEVVAPKSASVDPNYVPAASKTQSPYATIQYVTDMATPSRTGFTQDVVQLPPAGIGPDGMPVFTTDGFTPAEPGKIVMRVKFVDYLGTYVEHCHRLPHEDRGMMTLVRSIPHEPLVAVAAAGGAASSVALVRATDRAVVATVAPFDGFTGPLAVAMGDVDGDAVPDLAVASGPGRATTVRVLTGASGYTRSVFDGELAPFDTSTNGASLALGDLNGDGKDDLVVGEGPGGRSRVVLFDAVGGTKLAELQPYGADFTGGVNVAAAMVEEGGRVSFFTAPGSSRGPEVHMYNVDLFGDVNARFPDVHAKLEPILVASFDGADPSYQGGLGLATGYPFARKGGFATLVTSTAKGQGKLGFYSFAVHGGHAGHGAANTPSGVHRAVAYVPDAPREARRVLAVDLVAQDSALAGGVVVGAVSTLDGALLVTVPREGGAARPWTVNVEGTGLEAAPSLERTGSFVSGM